MQTIALFSLWSQLFGECEVIELIFAIEYFLVPCWQTLAQNYFLQKKCTAR